MNITISNGTLEATINPQGAELNSLKKDTTEYIWEGDPAFWGKHSPVLFPIVGTLKSNTYWYNDRQYNLTRHGFARDNEFVLKSHEDNKAVFSLKSNNETKKGYPFDFELELVYTLNGNTLSLDYVITNTGNIAMPFSIGAHPAFALPGNFEDYCLEFEKDEPLVSNQLVNDLLSDITETLAAPDGRLNLSYLLFEKDALIFTSLQSKSIAISKNNNRYLTVNFEGFPHLGIWTKVNAPFICIEPWQGFSDRADTDGDIFTKEGMLMLEPGKKHTVGFSVEIA